MNKISLRKRSNGWEYRFQMASVDGKQQSQSRGGFRTKKEADEAGTLAQTEYIRGGVSSLLSNQSFADYLDYWMQHYCAANLKSTTCVGYEKKIRIHIKPALGGYMLYSISTLVLQNFINKLFDDGYSRNTLSVIKGILSGAFSFAISPAAFLTNNPMTTVRLPNKRAQASIPTRKKVRSVLTVGQWQSILQRFPQGHSCHLALHLGYHLGVRLGEAFAICWNDVDFKQRTININKQVQWGQEAGCWFSSAPKYDSYRTLAIDPLLYDVLSQAHEQQLRGKAYYGQRYTQICVNEVKQLGSQGMSIDLVNKREDGSYIQPRVTQHMNHVIHTQLGMPQFDFHTLRHTHTTMILEAGANPLDVQERLGHTKLSMTWRYAHNTDTIRNQTETILAALYA